VVTSATSSFKTIIPEITLAYSIGASSSRFLSAWFDTLNIGSSTWSIGQSSGGRFSLFDSSEKGGSERLSVLTSGYVGVGTLSPTDRLQVAGNITPSVDGVYGIGSSTLRFSTLHSINASTTNITLSGVLFDTLNSSGVAGQVLLSNGTSTRWVATSSLGITSSLSGGVNGFVARWTSPGTIGTSTLIDNGTVAGVNATSSSVTFMVQGSSGGTPFKVASSTGQALFTVTGAGAIVASSSVVDSASTTNLAILGLTA
jgi:hypothetical protein